MKTLDAVDTFATLADEWQQHCDSVMFSSNVDDYLNADSFRKIIAIGLPAIPHIMESYSKDQLPWGFAIQEITGEEFITDKNNFSPAEMKKHCFDWWESQP